jgi:hypothetical protein
VKKFEKVKSFCGACKSRFVKQFFLLFGAILTVVFESVVFNPSKIIQGTFLGPFLLKKWFLERQLMGLVTVLF